MTQPVDALIAEVKEEIDFGDFDTVLIKKETVEAFIASHKAQADMIVALALGEEAYEAQALSIKAQAKMIRRLNAVNKAQAAESDRLRARVLELLEANNRYQQEARDARAMIRQLVDVQVPLEAFINVRDCGQTAEVVALGCIDDDQTSVSVTYGHLREIGTAIAEARAMIGGAS